MIALVDAVEAARTGHGTPPRLRIPDLCGEMPAQCVAFLPNGRAYC